MDKDLKDLKRRAGITEQTGPGIYQAINLIDVFVSHMNYLSEYDKKRLAQDLEIRGLDIDTIKRSIADAGKQMEQR